MIHRAAQFLRYSLQAKTRFAVHSPFVFDFVSNVLPPRPCPVDAVAKEYRKKLLSSHDVVEIEDFGAGYGGKEQSYHKKRISEVLKSSARPAKEGGLLFRVGQRYQPRQVLELGTNLGFSAFYQAAAVPDAEMITIEGATNLAAIAGKMLSVQCPKVRVLQGEFGGVLRTGIDWNTFRPGQVLIDGNHRYEPTIDYFQFLLPRVADGALLVFDDIHWSSGMTRAWQEIIRHPDVTVSLDLYSMGLCWVRRNQAKEHFVIRF